MTGNPTLPGGQELSPGAQSMLQAILGAGADVAAASGQAPAPPWQQGRVPVTGSSYRMSLGLPSWLDTAEVERAASSAAQNGDMFDPYFGSIRNGEVGTGAAVYWGRGKKYRAETGKIAYSHSEHMVNGEVINTPTTTRETVEKTGDKHLTVSAALNQPYMWSDEEQRAQVANAVKLGLLPAGSTFDDFVSRVWQGAVWRAAKTYDASQGQRKVTPFDVIDMYGKEAQAGLNPNDPNSPNFTGTKTETATSINQLSEGQAWAALRNTLSGMLGRDPSDRELRNFTYKMNGLAAANPTITHTTAQYKDGQEVSRNSVTSGGFTTEDAAQAAYDNAQQSKEYGAYQAATSYFNSVLSALGAIGNVGSN